MKTRLLILSITLILIFSTFTGCGTPSDPPAIEGLIFSVDGNQFLVVAGIGDVNIPYEQWFEAGNSAILFTVTNKTRFFGEGKKVSNSYLRVGQLVRVWADGGIMKSHPGQAGANFVEFLTFD